MAPQSLLELGAELNSREVTIRGYSFKVRALSDAESAAIARLFPRPLPPLTRKDTTKGSAAPMLPETNDPGYLAASQVWTRRQWLYEIAVAQELVKLDGDESTWAAKLKEVADKLSGKLTEVEIVRVWQAIRDLFDETAETRAADALYVDMENVDADQIAEVDTPPASYGTTNAYLDARICERFGWPLEYVHEMKAGTKFVLRKYERFRQWEESKRV